MARFALALAAIVILTLSAGLTRGQPQVRTLSTGAASAVARYNTTNSFETGPLLMKHTAILPATQLSTQEEPPAPALLVYLALILVGSIGSVALARRRLHGED